MVAASRLRELVNTNSPFIRRSSSQQLPPPQLPCFDPADVAKELAAAPAGRQERAAPEKS